MTGARPALVSNGSGRLRRPGHAPRPGRRCATVLRWGRCATVRRCRRWVTLRLGSLGADDRGMATAEFAAAMPAVAAALLLALGGVAAGIDQVRCVDAARLAARALARGDSMGAAHALAAGAAPDGATVLASGSADLVVVTVRSRRIVPGLGVGWTLTASATAQREQAPSSAGGSR